MEARAVDEVDRTFTIGPDNEVLFYGGNVKGFVDGGHFSYEVVVMRNGEGEALKAPNFRVTILVFKDSYTNP